MKLFITGAWKGEVVVDDESTVHALKKAIELPSHFPFDSIKLLLSGRQLKDDSAGIMSVGAAEGKTLMLMATQPVEGSRAPVVKTRQQEIDRLAAAARTLGARDPLMWQGRRRFVPELSNQDGSPVRLAEVEQAGLIEGMTLHAKAAQRLGSLDRDADGVRDREGAQGAAEGVLSSSLALLLRADEAFSRVPKKFLALLDNPPRLYLDIAWTYFRLGDMGHLAAAEEYITRAATGFAAAHGPGLTRLVQLKGASGAAPDRLLYVRLHLLQGVVAALRGDTGRASCALCMAQSEAAALSIRPADLSSLQGMGYSLHDARAALRTAAGSALARGGTQAAAWSGDAAASAAGMETRIGAALGAALDAREAAASRLARERVATEERRRVARYGSTVGGQAVNVKLVDALFGSGLCVEEELVVEAVRQADNDHAMSVQLLTGSVECLLCAIIARAEDKEAKRAGMAARKLQARGLAAAEHVAASHSSSNATGSAPLISVAPHSSIDGSVGRAHEGGARDPGSDEIGDEDQDAADSDGDDDDDAVAELAEALASGRTDETRWLTHPDPLARETAAIQTWLAKIGHSIA